MSPGEVSDAMDAAVAAAESGGEGPSPADYGGAFDFGGIPAGFGAEAGIPGLGPSQTGPMHSPGLSYATLQILDDIGLGKMDLPGFTQTVEQALAAQNAHSFLNQNIGSIMGLMVPGAGAMLSGAQTLGNLLSGNITPGQVLSSFGLGMLNSNLGLPSGTLSNVASGQYGPAVGNAAQSGLASLIGSNLGINPGLVNMGLGALDVGKGIGQSVTDAFGTGPNLLGGLAAPGAAPSTVNASSALYGDAGDAANATEALLAEIAPKEQAPAKQPAWTPQTIAGRYGPTVQYDFGA